MALLTLLFFTQLGYSQAPKKMSYQAVVRNAANVLVANTPVGIKISIYYLNQDPDMGPFITVYSERQVATTNQNGLFSIAVGTGTVLLGNFNNINWGTNEYYIKSQIDITGGSNYSLSGSQQLMSVPYAYYANQSGGGKVLLNGTTDPQSNIGTPSDFYINTTNNKLFGPKTATGWLATGVSLVGPQGLTGAIGPTGPQGIQGLTGATGVIGPQGIQGLTGATGPLGATGLTGAIGASGPQGPIGLTGNTGATGATGPQGIQGLNGTNGAQGPIGLTGPTGATGVIGPQGIQGLTGASGQQGPTGNTGPQGLQGIAGTNGTNGINGIDGIQGPAGPQGPQGPIGLTGATGPQGIPGNDGVTGPQGPVGLTGAIGVQGLTGATGPEGIAGINGTNGLSAYQIWLNAGNTGTEAQFLTSLQGVIGTQGLQGIPGINGINAADGKNTLVKTTTEAAGANCTTGGTKVEIGLDANSNGVLDTAEINATLTKYICNGSVGATGAQGIQGSTGPSDGAPAGAIISWSGPLTSIITGPYLLCDGSNVSRTTYSELFSVLGTTYGAGDGINTFSLPNIQSRVISGYNSTDSNFNSIGLTGGTNSNTLVANNLPTHTHSATTIVSNSATTSITDPGHSHLLVYGGSVGANRSVYGDYLLGGPINIYTPPTPQANTASAVSGPAVAESTTTGISASTSVSSTATSTIGNNTTTNIAVNNLQPYIVMRYYIKYSAGNTSIGVTGPQGASGPQGIQGLNGEMGATGPQGPIGLTGATGLQGATGPQGPAGQNGTNGVDGTAGPNGPQGSIGLTGATGAQGLTGANGTNGQDGKNTLVNTTAEPTGANCANGGTKIEVGLDANNDGVLNLGEINSSLTKYVCNGSGSISSSSTIPLNFDYSGSGLNFPPVSAGGGWHYYEHREDLIPITLNSGIYSIGLDSNWGSVSSSGCWSANLFVDLTLLNSSGVSPQIFTSSDLFNTSLSGGLGVNKRVINGDSNFRSLGKISVQSPGQYIIKVRLVSEANSCGYATGTLNNYTIKITNMY